MTRKVERRYQDPLDRVWTACAEALGLRLERSDAVYASVRDGRVLTLGTPATLDADDNLAQMIFHEICHALVQCGDDQSAWTKRDWGLDNRSERDAHRERATLRLQATIAMRHGLRRFFAPTTDYRAFWDRLADDPFEDAPEDERRLVKLALDRASSPPFAPHLEDALLATSTIVATVAPFSCSEIRSLFDPP